MLGTEPYYTVTSDNAEKTLCVEVTVNGYTSSATLEAGDVVPKVTGVSVVDGVDGFTPVTAPKVGQKLLANIDTTKGTIGGYPVDPDANYKWYYQDSTDTAIGSEPYYTVTNDNAGKTICVEVSVAGFAGSAVWEAGMPVLTVTGVSVVDGIDGWTPVTDPVVGQKLLANIATNAGEIGGSPVNPDARYKWYYKESPDTVLGTEAYYTITSDNEGKTICVEVSVDYYAGTAVWEASGIVQP